MQQSTILVTGAGSGIGRATALALASQGHQVIGLHRTQTSAQMTCADPHADIQCEIADLSDIAQIRALVDRLKARLDHLDLIVNAAGVQPWERREAKDGTELTWATNVRAPFLLSEWLVPLLSARVGHVLNVSSMVHKWGEMDWDDLEKQRSYDSNVAYYQSKLALMLWTMEAARRHKGKIRFNSMHPGMTRTDFARDFRGFYRAMARLTRPFQRSPEDVANDIVKIAFDAHNQTVTGAYFSHSKIATPAPRATRQADCERLWSLLSADL